MVEFAAIRRANPLPEIVRAYVRLTRSGNEWKARCPFHRERTPSFTIFGAGERFHCFGCGAKGDVFDFVQLIEGIGFNEAVASLSFVGSPSIPSDVVRGRTRQEGRQRQAARKADALSIWDASLPSKNTLAAHYLVSRSITLPAPDCIRFARLRYARESQAFPCLVAAVTGPDGRLQGIQRTFLNEIGTGKAEIPQPRLSLGSIAGGAIRCADPAETLIVTEGLEDALSAMQLFNLPAWAAGGAGMIAKMKIPVAVETVIIGADNDEAGQRAAYQAARSFSEQGLEVRILRPVAGAKDFNDQLRNA